MTKFERFVTDETNRKVVLKILELLNGETLEDAKEILKAAEHFLKQNSYFDYSLAHDLIISVEGSEK